MISIVDAQVVNEGQVWRGNIKIDGDHIVELSKAGESFVAEGEVIDARGRYVMPGVIDEHVHFREPGLTSKGDIRSESRAAAAGGVTTYFDMPNTKPQTTTVAALKDKQRLGSQQSVVNYAFYIGATNDNIDELEAVDFTLTPAIKLFMGASTGNMLVEREEVLSGIFGLARRKGVPVVAHCEDTNQIIENGRKIRETVGENAGVEYHPIIRNEKVCLDSTLKAISLAQKSGAQLLVAHVSTWKELEAIHGAGTKVNAEVCVSYLYFSAEDYGRLGGRIKCNPAIKSPADQRGLIDALGHKNTEAEVICVATDHAPHLIADKEGGVFQASSGMPSVQFSLPLMLQFVDRGEIKIEDIVRYMSHNPAQYFGVLRRGFIRVGYKADLVMVSHNDVAHTVTDADVLSKCGWTPYVGQKLNWAVDMTLCNGMVVYDRKKGFVASCNAGQQVEFLHQGGAL